MLGRERAGRISRRNKSLEKENAGRDAPLHAITAKSRAGIGITDGRSDTAVELVEAWRESTSKSSRRQALPVTRPVLQDVRINGLGLQAVQRRQMGLSIRRLVLGRHRIESTRLRSVEICKRAAWNGLRKAGTSQSLVGKRHVDQTMLTSISSSEVVHLLSLQLILDSFSVWRITNERKNRADAFNKQGPLRRLGIV